MARATRSPAGARRSAVIAAVTAAIARRSMTSITSRIAMRPAQERPQSSPRRTPCRHAVAASAGSVRRPRLFRGSGEGSAPSSVPVLVVTPPPDPGLVAPFGCPVEPLVHAPQAVESARVGGIRVIDDAVLEGERAHARPLTRVSGGVGPGHGRDLPHRPVAAAKLPRALATVVVFDAALALLLLGEPDIEVGVEVGVERGRPRKRPTHPLLVGLQLRERGA